MPTQPEDLAPSGEYGWERLGLDGGYVGELAAGPDGWVYAASARSLYRSHDGGANWKQRKKAFHSPDITSLIETPSGSLLAGTEAKPESVEEFGPMGDGKYAGVYRSTDEGRSWKRVLNQRMDSVWALVTDSDGGIVAGCTDRVARSTDDGLSWVDLDLPTGPDWTTLVLSVAVDGDGTIFAGTTRGLYCGRP
ncbi:WD40/YVTN/BNR-like repeat-containing protein [Candidatus Latescibacterota bacterium]